MPHVDALPFALHIALARLTTTGATRGDIFVGTYQALHVHGFVRALRPNLTSLIFPSRVHVVVHLTGVIVLMDVAVDDLHLVMEPRIQGTKHVDHGHGPHVLPVAKNAI